MSDFEQAVFKLYFSTIMQGSIYTFQGVKPLSISFFCLHPSTFFSVLLCLLLVPSPCVLRVFLFSILFSVCFCLLGELCRHRIEHRRGEVGLGCVGQRHLEGRWRKRHVRPWQVDARRRLVLRRAAPFSRCQVSTLHATPSIHLAGVCMQICSLLI